MVTYGYDIAKLARRKAELGLTDIEVARRAQVCPSTIANLLTGRRCKGPTVKAVANVLGMNLADLVIPAAEEVDHG